MENEFNYINGPVVSVRLEGKIENINKTIYLFGDVHYPKNKQTSCKTINEDSSAGFIKYLKKNITGSDNNIFDLFFELGPLYKNTIVPTKNKKHIDNVAHFFIKSFNVKNNKNLGVLIDNKKNKKLRLHYVDYRDLLKNKFNTIFDKIRDEIHKNCDKKKIVKLLEMLKDEYNNTVIIFLQGTTKSILLPEKNNNVIYKLIYKIFNKYTHNFIKDILVDKFITDKIKELSDLFNEYITYFVEKIDTFDNKTMFLKQLTKVDNSSFKSYSYIIDAYLLRRFLDKDYITHGIVYMGVYHILFYCYVLVNYFGFKITNFSDTSIDINEFTKLIKKNQKFTDDLVDSILKNNNVQCSNIINFPKNFE